MACYNYVIGYVHNPLIPKKRKEKKRKRKKEKQTMPFDPVRDAVLNSPISPSQPFSADHPPRRATDLAVLLNDSNDPPLRSPTRTSSLSHLLLHSYPDYDHNKLSLSHPSRISVRTPALPPQIRHSHPSSPSSTSSSHLPTTPSPADSPSMLQHPLSTIPYNPRRITQATSVLIPLSQAEVEKYRDYRGIGTQRLSKRKRTSDDDLSELAVKKLQGS